MKIKLDGSKRYHMKKPKQKTQQQLTELVNNALMNEEKIIIKFLLKIYRYLCIDICSCGGEIEDWSSTKAYCNKCGKRF